MNKFISNISVIYRGVSKHLAYYFLIFSGLTIGLTVFINISLYTYSELSTDKYFDGHDRIYRLINSEKNNCWVDYDLTKIIKQNYSDIDNVVPLLRIKNDRIVLKNDSSNIIVNTISSTTNDFFKTFKIKVIEKVGNKPFADNESIVLTKSIAKRMFGDANPLGQKMVFFGKINVVVSAVIDDFPANSSIASSVLVNAENEQMRFNHFCNNDDCYTPFCQFIQLKPNVDKYNFITGFNKSIKNYQSRINNFSIQRFDNIYLSKNIDGSCNDAGNATLMKIIMFIGLIILILAVINYLNFSLSLQSSKIKEISVKKIHGASKLQLFWYYFSETSHILVIVYILSIVLTSLLSSYFSSFFDRKIDINILYQPYFIAFIATVFVVIVLINSIIPMLAISKVDIIDGLNKIVKRKNENAVKSFFTIIQFTVSIVLLVMLLVVIKQLNYVKNNDIGFDEQNLLKVNIPKNFNQINALQQEINKLSFVVSSTKSNGTVGQCGIILGSGVKSKDFEVKSYFADSNFVKTFKISIIKGRNFIASDNGLACLI